MSLAHFRFAPDILRRLGEELNPHPSVGIIELVKNAYDADARKCTVKLTDVDKPGGEVEIIDDGNGMELDQIQNGWLVLGHSQKAKRRRTKLGRIPAGNKGLGRLAALRLGRFANLVTSPRSKDSKIYNLLIDWKMYDSALLINDVDLTIDIKKRNKGDAFGTTISLEKIRDRIGRQEVKQLARAMLLLADPFGENNDGFHPKLIAPEYSDLEKLVERRYFEHASYHLIAKVDKKRNATAELFGARGKHLYSANDNDLFPKADEKLIECPEVEFEFWSFKLDSTTFDQLPVTIQEVKSWISEFGGIHIYQNGLRVAPYGDPGHDWLSINLARAKNPEERPSTNNSIGRVKIDDSEELLVQKTDRSGFIESYIFQEIRRFAQASLEWMADRRMAVAEKRRTNERKIAPIRTSKSKKLLEQTIDSAPPKLREQLKEAVQQYGKTRDREVEELKKEVQLYRTLSTAGITAATFAHESTGNPLKVINSSINTIERRAKECDEEFYNAKLLKAVERVKMSIESLGVLDEVTLSLLEHEKRISSKVIIHEVVNKVVKTFQPFFTDRNVKLQIEFADGSPWLEGREAAVESIVTNLINNSLVAIEGKPPEKRNILIKTIINDVVLQLSVMDSGTGIKDIRLPDIWLPGKTTRKNGTGLGLTIVKDTVFDLGGKVGAKESSLLGGAEIYVELPIIGV